MPSSSTTKRSTAQIVSPTEYSGSNTLQQYDQGVYINDINVLIGSAVTKLRPNNDFLKVKRGVKSRATDGFFDDTESPTSLAISGTVGSITVYEKSYIPISFFQEIPVNKMKGEKFSGVTLAPSHYNLDNDFGQPDYYQDGSAYSERDASLNPLWIIEADPLSIPVLISKEMVNSSEMTSIDGVIDPFSVRKEADRSFTEIPFRFKGIRGDMVNDNVYRRSVMIMDEQPSYSATQRSGPDGTLRTYSTDPFLDAGDEMGLDDLAGSSETEIGPVNLEGFVMPETSVLSPYKDSDDSELTALLLSGSNDMEMMAVVLSLTGSNNFPTHDFLSRDHITLGHGFVYDNNYTGVESLAFGGLLK